MNCLLQRENPWKLLRNQILISVLSSLFLKKPSCRQIQFLLEIKRIFSNQLNGMSCRSKCFFTWIMNFKGLTNLNLKSNYRRIRVYRLNGKFFRELNLIHQNQSYFLIRNLFTGMKEEGLLS